MESHEALILWLIELCQSKESVDENARAASRDPVFDPERVIAHCFRQFKQEHFRLPRSRRRVIILPGNEDLAPVPPVAQPPTAPQPAPTSRVPELEDAQEQREDRGTWLSQRLKLRRDLDALGDPKRWLQHKASLTPSEATVLSRLRGRPPAPPGEPLAIAPFAKKKCTRLLHRAVPQLQLPRPPALLAFYSYVRGRKVKILEVFNKVARGESQKVSREEFFLALKTFGVPLKYQEVEDIVIYLSSLGKNNAITTEVLENTYKKWHLAEQTSSLPTMKQHYRPSRVRALHGSPKKVSVAPEPPKLDLLTVPLVHVEKELRPLTLEEMEDVGKRYRERRRQQSKSPRPSMQYLEQCRLVRSGVKPVDDHCLPSTMCGEMKELVDAFRQDTFLVYLRCWKLCAAYGLPLTEALLMKALLYPGDKIVLLEDQVRPIRQPGGYYLDSKKTSRLKAARPRLPLLGGEAKKLDQKSSRRIKRIYFKEFEAFIRKMRMRRMGAAQKTHPNFFWPGHLLDKLRLYLPTVAMDRSLAIFSCVHRQPPVYPATYHSNCWWPIMNKNYLTYAPYDAHKVYHIN